MFCPVIDHDFSHNIVNVAVDPRGDSRYFDNVMTKFIVNNRTDAWKTDIIFFFTITNCQIFRSRLLKHPLVCLSIENEKLAKKRARISVVIVKKFDRNTENMFSFRLENCVTK